MEGLNKNLRIPRHIAIIPDGNRRWADGQGLKPWEGHEKGIQKFKDIVEWCHDIGVQYITAYTLSTENLSKRKRVEIKFLFNLYEKYIRQVLDSPEVYENKIKVKFIGSLHAFPDEIKLLMEQVEEKTKDHTNGTIILCMNYGGRTELIDAAKRFAQDYKEGKVGLEDLTEERFSDYLYTHGIPDPDLLIRTMEHRTSNFLPWQLAYSELYFIDKPFPSLTKDDFIDAIYFYNKTKRKFGK